MQHRGGAFDPNLGVKLKERLKEYFLEGYVYTKTLDIHFTSSISTNTSYYVVRTILSIL
jgi:hypothetical protein